MDIETSLPALVFTLLRLIEQQTDVCPASHTPRSSGRLGVYGPSFPRAFDRHNAMGEMRGLPRRSQPNG